MDFDWLLIFIMIHKWKKRVPIGGDRGEEGILIIAIIIIAWHEL